MSLTTTSYAILGLLDIRDWTAYELAQQANRSLAFAWPVSESQLYAEPKRLAAAGFLTITKAPAGPERRRRVYAITAAGRDELRAWLGREPASPRLHAEVLLRCLFAPSGSTDDLLAALDATRQAVTHQYRAGLDLVDGYLGSDNPFPERLHANILWMKLIRDLHILLIDWAADATAQVQAWTDSTRGGDNADLLELVAKLPAAGRVRGLNP